MTPKTTALLSIFTLVFLLSGCQFFGSLFMGAQRVGAILFDDRSLSDDWNDTSLNMSIRNALQKKDIKYAVDVEITVFEGVVLLNGAIPSVALIDEIIETTWQVPNVKKVYNYIRVAEPLGIDQVNTEAALSAKIRYELAFTKGVSGANYKITLENGVVYLMGITASDEELEKVIAVIKNTGNVEKIITLTRKKGNPSTPH